MRVKDNAFLFCSVPLLNGCISHCPYNGSSEFCNYKLIIESVLMHDFIFVYSVCMLRYGPCCLK